MDEYIVVEGESRQKLAEMVNEKIEEDYRPIGGIAIFQRNDYSRATFYQSLVRKVFQP